MGSRAAAFAAFFVLALAPRVVAADDPAAGDDRGRDRIRAPSRKLHVPLTLALAAAYAVAEGPLKDPLSADECGWCGPVLFDASLRDGLVWSDVDRARSLSNLTGYIGAAVWAVGGVGLAAHVDGRGRARWFDDALIIAEATAFTGLLNFTVKALTTRERPFVFHLSADEKPLTPHPQDNNQSFYSGHAAVSMSLAVSAGTIARLRGYSSASYLYAGGITISLAAGYFRIAGDKHWTTDVLTGWLLGAAVGYALPTYLHRRRATTITPVLSPSSVGFAVRW